MKDAGCRRRRRLLGRAAGGLVAPRHPIHDPAEAGPGAQFTEVFSAAAQRATTHKGPHFLGKRYTHTCFNGAPQTEAAAAHDDEKDDDDDDASKKGSVTGRDVPE